LNWIAIIVLLAGVEEPSVWGDTIEQHVESCSSVSPDRKFEAKFTAAVMLSVEKSVGIPDDMMGMSIAAAGS